MRLTVHRDLAFCHGLQQRRLRARRGAVDLVGKDEVGEQRTGTKLELSDLLIIEIDAGQVAGQKIRRALHALEAPADGGGEGAQKHGFPGSRHVLQQDMAAAEEADEDTLDDLTLADDDGFALGNDAVAVLSQLKIRHGDHSDPNRLNGKPACA